MESQLQRKNSSSGQEVHLCHKCGWPFPNPHPSARHRRAHKKVCGTVEGFKVRLDAGADEDEHQSDDEKTPSNGSKTVEKSTRRVTSRSGRSEEELFADAVTDFADVREPANVAIADAGNLYPPSSANGAQAHTAECLTPENERSGIDSPPQQNLSSSTLDSVPSLGSVVKEGESSAGETSLDDKSEEVANEEHFGSDGKIDSLEKSVQATEDGNEEVGRRLETFASCNDRFYNLVETDHLLMRERSEVILEDNKDQRTEIGEIVDSPNEKTEDNSSEALLQDPKSVEDLSVENFQQDLNLTDASARNFLDDIDSITHSMKGVKPAGESLELEADITNVAKEELAYTSESFSEVEKLSESALVGPVSDEMPVDQAEAERKLEHELLEDAVLLENNVQKNIQEAEAANSAISSTGDSVDANEPMCNDEDCVKKTSGPVDVSILNNVVDDDAELRKNEISGEKVFGQECMAEVSENDVTQSIAITEERDLDLLKQEETVNALEIQVGSDTAKGTDVGLKGETRLTEEKEGINSGFTDGEMNLMKEEETVSTFDIGSNDKEDRNLVKREETATVSALDVQADTSSQTDSLEANWGSVSVLSALSDAPAPTETGSQPSQPPVKLETPVSQPRSNDDKSEISKPSSFASSVKQKEGESGQSQAATEASVANESPGSKKNEEIVAKVTKWSTEKLHMPLKSFLGDSSSPKNTVTDAKEPAKGEVGPEWNSPAKYPTNSKREKGKAKSRTWVPFICCSSVQTS